MTISQTTLLWPKQDVISEYAHFQTVKSSCVSPLFPMLLFSPYDMQWFCCQHDILTVHLSDEEILFPPSDDST